MREAEFIHNIQVHPTQIRNNSSRLNDELSNVVGYVGGCHKLIHADASKVGFSGAFFHRLVHRVDRRIVSERHHNSNLSLVNNRLFDGRSSRRNASKQPIRIPFANYPPRTGPSPSASEHSSVYEDACGKPQHRMAYAWVRRGVVHVTNNGLSRCIPSRKLLDKNNGVPGKRWKVWFITKHEMRSDIAIRFLEHPVGRHG